MAPFLKYTVLRLGLFVAALALFAVAGAGELLSLLGAAVVSLALSYILLRGPRHELAERIATKVDARARERRPSGSERDAALEDAVDEANRTSAQE